MPPARFLSADDIAQTLNVERHTARKYMRQMPCVVIGRMRRVQPSVFNAWVQGHVESEEDQPEERQPSGRKATATSFQKDGRLSRRGT